jgi:ABC-2 type transport system permease protein
MRQLTAFARKELMENLRTGRFFILLIVFVLFGIMNPALAKLTPWLFKTLSETMEEQGIIVKSMEVTALTSWQQYYKNISLILMITVIMFSGVVTSEYQRGTLINILTKGFPRWKVIVSKATIQIGIWSLCYWLAFGITYAYTAYFWDNGIISHWFIAALCIYIVGIWLVSLIFLGSVFFESNIAVLIFTGIIFTMIYFIGMLPAVTKYLPTKLLTSGDLLTGAAEVGDFVNSILLTLLTSVLFFILSIMKFNKKRI